MNKLIQHFLVNSALGLLTSLVAATSYGSVDPGKPVDLGEVRAWKSIGPIWQAGLNEKGEIIALYDFSYPKVVNSALLGSIDPSAIGYGKVIDLLKTAKREMAEHTEILSTEESENLTDVDKAIESLEKLRIDAIAKPVDESLWWKEVPWKSNELKNGNQPPQRFTIADIQVGKMKALVNESPITKIEFVRNAQGHYEFYFRGKLQTGREMRASGDEVEPPVKIADLRCSRCGLDERMSKDDVRGRFDRSFPDVKVPYMKALLSAALEQYYSYEDELLYNHQEMVFELMREMEENPSAFSPQVLLSAQDREAILTYLMYARTSISNAKDLKAMEAWSDSEKGALSQAQASVDYFKVRNRNVQLLNPRFATEQTPGSEMLIYSLSAPRYWNILPPFMAFDGNRPTMIRNIRIAIESAHVLVQFLKIFCPVPFVGTIVAKAYHWILEGPMHTVQHWEARLQGHLYSRVERGENWELALDMLSQQAINPMELLKDKKAELIQARKAVYKAQ